MAEDLRLFEASAVAQNNPRQKVRMITAWALFSWVNCIAKIREYALIIRLREQQAMNGYYMFEALLLRDPSKRLLPNPVDDNLDWYG